MENPTLPVTASMLNNGSLTHLQPWLYANEAPTEQKARTLLPLPLVTRARSSIAHRLTALANRLTAPGASAAQAPATPLS